MVLFQIELRLVAQFHIKRSYSYFSVQPTCLFGHIITQLLVVEFLNFDEIYSQFPGIITSTILNFTLLKLFVFKSD